MQYEFKMNMSFFHKSTCVITVFLLIIVSVEAQILTSENIASKEVWIDPSIDREKSVQKITVWFDKQFLGNSDSFLKRAEEFKDSKRSVLRKNVITTLKTINKSSINAIRDELSILEKNRNITNLTPHWIINGFSCEVNEVGLNAIIKLEGIAKVFKRQKSAFVSPNKSIDAEYINSIDTQFNVSEIDSYPWNIEKIGAPQVWKKYNVRGKGTLNVVHDFGFKLDLEPIRETLYVNKKEIPGNNIDDDLNGLVDDYHGYNFDSKNANLHRSRPSVKKNFIHGNACAAIISGTYIKNTKEVVGIAPESKWAPVIGSNIEETVEWAIEQGADTYSMSFSIPNLGELRTHWRKVIEHATFCGIVFVSGAGNFASGQNSTSIPVQMRIPEDIPNAVLGVAGINRNLERPSFSSQGPVDWSTDHYMEGLVNKPDFATLNFEIPCIDNDGNLSNVANGNSFAGPHMAGIVSLMLSANPELLPWDVKEILIKVADDIEKPGFDFQTGYGFVNAYEAVTEALKWKK